MIPKPIRRLSAFLQNLGSTFLFILLYPFKNSKLDRVDGSGRPVALLVHGWIHNETGWGVYRRQLKKAGFGAVHTLCYHSVKWDIPQNSTIIKERIEQIKRETGQDVNLLIGHSQGGLECLEYALEYASKGNTLYIVTLGSPLHGTKMTALGFGPSVRQMRLHSPYLETLHSRLAQASHIKILALAGDADFITLPQSSALLPEYPFATNEMIEDIGHMSFLFSRKPLKRIIDYLKREKLLS